MNLNLSNAAKALVEWEAAQVALDARLYNAMTNRAVSEYDAAQKESDDKLRLAFFEDTKDRNSRDSCLRIPAKDIARLVKTGSWK